MKLRFSTLLTLAVLAFAAFASLGCDASITALVSVSDSKEKAAPPEAAEPRSIEALAAEVEAGFEAILASSRSSPYTVEPAKHFTHKSRIEHAKPVQASTTHGSIRERPKITIFTGLGHDHFARADV